MAGLEVRWLCCEQEQVEQVCGFRLGTVVVGLSRLAYPLGISLGTGLRSFGERDAQNSTSEMRRSEVSPSLYVGFLHI